VNAAENIESVHDKIVNQVECLMGRLDLEKPVEVFTASDFGM